MRRAIEECDYMQYYDDMLENNVLSESVERAYRKVVLGERDHEDIQEKAKILKSELEKL